MSQSSSSLGSNNPFRRKSPSVPVPQYPANPSASPDGQSAAESLAGGNLALPTKPPAISNSDQFRNQLRALGQSSQPAPATTFQKAKVVKKVRVQSPPPSSPESTGVPDRYPRTDYGKDGGYGDDDESESSDDDDDEDTDDEIRDPFGNRPIPLSSEKGDQLYTKREDSTSFPKTSRDFEVGWNEVPDPPSVVAGASGARGTLDVNAFGRLLLTGETGAPVSLPITGSKPIPLEDSRISREGSMPTELDADNHRSLGRAQARKPPPAPSSRHGKLINSGSRTGTTSTAEHAIGASSSSSPHSDKEFRAQSPTSPLQQRPLTPSDINKPLPPAPLGPPHGDSESIFDREAAGKVPELDVDPDELLPPVPKPPTPPNTSHAIPVPSTATTHPPAKPTPPPRRHPHGRSDSKLSVTSIPSSTPAQSEGMDLSPRRSSQESVRSRSSSLRANIHAPAPPPPRRSGHPPPPPPHRGSGAFVSPSNVSFSSVTSAISERGTPEAVESPSISAEPLSIPDEVKGGSNINLYGTPGSHTPPAVEAAVSPSLGLHPNHSSSKIKPPPPPARSVSIRSKRPPSVSSLEATSRRVATSGHSSMAPPPPPPPSRQRGGSKGSIDGSGANRTSIDSVRILPGTLAEEPSLTGNNITAGGISPGLESPDNPPAGSGNGMSANDILADLTALQREVDALRGRYEKESKG